jgi:uncharacterized protein YqjF (DUF2071 family)
MPAPPMDEIGTAMMVQQWRQLTFLHWRYPADAVQALLPAELTPHTMDGDVWVGLIPFLMDDVRPPKTPGLPWLSRFPETNLRTYVTEGFANVCRHDWHQLGEFPIAGFSKAQRVYGLAEEAHVQAG